MSLDIYLSMPGTVSEGGTGIFVREDGQTKEISREEWDAMFPGREPVVVDLPGNSYVFEWNITHNLGHMASECGLYDAMWRPEEQGWTKAHQLIEPLEKGLAELQSNPDKYKAFNPENRWGSYYGLETSAQAYLEACKQYPNADVEVSR